MGRSLENPPNVDVQFATQHEDSLTSQCGLCIRDDVAFPDMRYGFLPLTRRLGSWTGTSYRASGTGDEGVVDTEARVKAV